MNNNFKEVINKGVPISTPVNILLNDLLEMTDNKKKLDYRLSKKYDKFMEFLQTKCRKNDIEFFMTLSILSDPYTLEKKLIFATSGFISSILFNLNVDNICSGYKTNNKKYSLNLDNFKKEFGDKITDRINVLKMTSRESKLQRSFPFLYEKYKVYEDFYKSIREIKEKIESTNITPLQALKIKSDLEKFYREQGYDYSVEELFKKAEEFSIESFSRSYAETFKDIWDNFEEIINFLEEYTIDIDSLDIDNEKLELYIAYQSLDACKHNNDKGKQRFIYYVSNYFNSDKTRKSNNDIEIEIGKVKNKNIKMEEEKRNGIKVTPSSLYEEYKKFLKENPEVKVINLGDVDFSGMTLEEVETFILEYIKDLQANWELIPEEDYEEEMVKNLKGDYKGTATYQGREVSEERLLEMYIDKKAFFGNTDPFFRIKGKNTFDGYIGYLYTNGKVVLERYFEKAKTGKLAYGEAIYIMNIEDFYRLSHYPKKVLMKDSNVTRIPHSGDWQTEVEKIINRKNKQARTAEEVRKLIKTKEIIEEE